jgi:hypothetical protein
MKRSIIILLFIPFYYLNAQCSDAGVCSIGGHIIETNKNSFSVSYSYGYSGSIDDIKYQSINFLSKFFLNDKSYIGLFLPFGKQSGPLGSAIGLGDFIAIYNYQLVNNDVLNMYLSGGLKIATSSFNKDNPLPQSYQSGLGTNDLLVGISISISDLSFSTGYQIAGGRNTEVSPQLKRCDDLLIKGGYQFAFSELHIQAEVLYIKRVGKSSVLADNSLLNQYYDIADSDQEQLNLQLIGNFPLGEDTNLFGSFALPFIDRKINVDGLTRKFSIELGVNFKI